MTMLTYPCNNDNTFETATAFGNYDKAGSSDSDMDIDTGRGHDEDSATASGCQVHIWSRP